MGQRKMRLIFYFDLMYRPVDCIGHIVSVGFHHSFVPSPALFVTEHSFLTHVVECLAQRFKQFLLLHHR
jgi:hypothetical protein